jgi:hypothetical protein
MYMSVKGVSISQYIVYITDVSEQQAACMFSAEVCFIQNYMESLCTKQYS